MCRPPTNGTNRHEDDICSSHCPYDGNGAALPRLVARGFALRPPAPGAAVRN